MTGVFRRTTALVSWTLRTSHGNHETQLRIANCSGVSLPIMAFLAEKAAFCLLGGGPGRTELLDPWRILFLAEAP